MMRQASTTPIGASPRQSPPQRGMPFVLCLRGTSPWPGRLGRHPSLRRPCPWSLRRRGGSPSKQPAPAATNRRQFRASLPAWRPDHRLFPAEPENGVGRMTLTHNETVTSIDPRVSGSGCAQMRKTGREARNRSYKPGQKEARVLPCCFEPLSPQGRRAMPRPAQIDPSPRGRTRRGFRPGIGWTGFFTGEPESAAGRLTQVQNRLVTSVDPRVPGSGCAKMRKTGAHTAPERVHMGAEAS
jgi:hypothetical protein